MADELVTDLEIRQIVADALAYASVPGFKGSAEAASFVAGTSDIRLDQFEIDSLATMELCIAIELNVGVSIVPAELAEVATLAGVVTLARERLGA